MDRELAQLQKYGVYERVDNVPPNGKVIDTKWVVREKEEKPVSEKPKATGCSASWWESGSRYVG